MSSQVVPNFVVSFDAAGVHRWSRVLAEGTTPSYDAQAFGVSSRGDTVTVVGTFGQPFTAAHVGSMHLGGSAPDLDGAGDLDAFVATFDEATGVARDARAIASSGQEQGATIIEDAHGIVIGGRTSAGATLPLAGGVVSHGGASFIAYGDGLTPRWAWTNADALETRLAPLSGDRYVISGWFRAMIDLGAGHAFTASAMGQDGFVLMLAP